MVQRINTHTFQQAVSWVLVALVLYFVYRVVKAFLVPLTWAAVLTIFFFPVHRWVARKVLKPNLAALLTVAGVTMLLVAPVVWLVPAFVGEALSTIRSLPSEELLPRVRSLLDQLEQFPVPLPDFEQLLREASQKAGTFLAQQSARIAGNLALFVFDLVVMILAMFYLFRDGPEVVGLVRDISPLGGEHRDRMMQEVVELISVTLSSGMIVAIVQGALGGLVFSLLDMPSAVFWGVIIALLAFLPVVGPWLVWGPAAIGLIFGGSSARGIALLVLGFVVVSGADNVLRPMLIAGRSQLNGLLVFVSVLGGINAFGFLGVVLGPLVVATAVGLLRGYRESLREQSIVQPGTEAA